MKIALALGIVLAYLATQATGFSDVPSIAEELLVPSVSAIAFSVVFLRFCGGPIWLPALIVGLGIVALNYPVQTLVGHVEASLAADDSHQRLLFTALSVARVAPFPLSVVASLAYRTLGRSEITNDRDP